MNKIKNLPLLERPYEKLKYLGSDSLSNSELLSIIIKTGIKNLNSIQISQIIFSNFENGNNFNFLQDISVEELKSFLV
jgi:DNA repair protein RadC